MTRDDLLQILRNENFDFDYELNEICYKGERVGDFAGDAVWLCDFQPSVVGLSYIQVHKTIINANAIDAVRRLYEQIANFLDTPRRYEEYCRQYRIDNVKKYFKSMSAKELHQ